DVAGAMGVYMAYLGDRAGVFDALDGAGRLTVSQLAEKTGMNPKYLREWLGSVAGAGYVNHHAANGSGEDSFSIDPEQALVIAREGQPACMQGFFQAIVSQYESYEKASETFRSGEGRPWGDHTQCLFCGVDRFFRPGYQMNLVDVWIPALAG